MGLAVEQGQGLLHLQVHLQTGAAHGCGASFGGRGALRISWAVVAPRRDVARSRERPRSLCPKALAV